MNLQWIQCHECMYRTLRGYINTPLIASPDLDPLKLLMIKDTPIGRLGEVDDLVGVMLYLASPGSDFMTGTDLLVDGGVTCW